MDGLGAQGLFTPEAAAPAHGRQHGGKSPAKGADAPVLKGAHCFGRRFILGIVRMNDKSWITCEWMVSGYVFHLVPSSFADFHTGRVNEAE